MARLNSVALRDDIRIIRTGNVGPEMFAVDFKRITTHGDHSQNVNLKNNDIVYVPRSFIKDINDVSTKIEPLLNVLLIPSIYCDLYTTGGGLRVGIRVIRQRRALPRDLADPFRVRVRW